MVIQQTWKNKAWNKKIWFSFFYDSKILPSMNYIIKLMVVMHKRGGGAVLIVNFKSHISPPPSLSVE